MLKQLRFIPLIAFLTLSFVLAGCQQSSSNVATTKPSPTVDPDLTPVASPTASPTPGEMKTSPSGLQYQDLQIGSGARPLMTQSVSVAYVGTFTDGKKFDGGVTDVKLGKGEFLKAWEWGISGNSTEGIEPMRVGGKRKLILPPQLGYGDKPNGPIPANSTLVFEIELLRIRSSAF